MKSSPIGGLFSTRFLLTFTFPVRYFSILISIKLSQNWKIITNAKPFVCLVWFYQIRFFSSNTPPNKLHFFDNNCSLRSLRSLTIWYLNFFDEKVDFFRQSVQPIWKTARKTKPARSMEIFVCIQANDAPRETLQLQFMFRQTNKMFPVPKCYKLNFN